MRCQIKLGQSTMDYQEFTDVVDTLATSSRRLHEKLGIMVTSIVAITRPLGRKKAVAATKKSKAIWLNAEYYAAEKGVVVWDRKHLVQHVWLPDIKKWAEACRLAVYYEGGTARGNSGQHHIKPDWKVPGLACRAQNTVRYHF